MAKTKTSSKKIAKEPDEFLTFTEKCYYYVKENIRLFQYIGIILLSLLTIYLGINAYLNHINRNALITYNKAFYKIAKDMGMETDKKVLEQSEELLKKLIEDYSHARISDLAYAELGYLKFKEKKWDDAIRFYREFIKKKGDKIHYRNLAQLAISACYEEKGDLESAIRILKSVVESGDEHFKQIAMLNLGRLYMEAEKPDKARPILEELLKRYPNSPFKPLVEARLKNLQSK